LDAQTCDISSWFKRHLFITDTRYELLIARANQHNGQLPNSLQLRRRDQHSKLKERIDLRTCYRVVSCKARFSALLG